MNYEFPIIRHIDDVLPHIEGRSEFIVAEREDYDVINYVVQTQHTFDMYPNGFRSGRIVQYDYGGAIRRECRGLIFYKDGTLMSRPFHKFFNVNERDETRAHEIDLSQPHVVMEKMDGSMIRPLIVDGYLRLGTKMGVTDVAMQAEEWLAKQYYEYKEWLYNCVVDGVTPLFEWVSSNNKIVLDYKEDNLVYLGTRDNASGKYVMDKSCPFDTVPQYGSVDVSLSEYVDCQRVMENREGDIIRFADGHMLKIKNDWYVRIHKVLDKIKFDRNIIELIIHNDVDDVIPMLPQVQATRVRDFETLFWSAFDATEERLLLLFLDASGRFENDRKRIALEFIPTMDRKEDAQFIFRMLDGGNLRDLMISHIEKSIGTNTKWDACAKWIGM